jgi:hypothetical protein
MHSLVPMRTHLQIIIDSGGYKGLAEKIGQPASRVRFWQRREAIPPELWKAVADAGIASLEELATAAAERREGQGAAA